MSKIDGRQLKLLLVDDVKGMRDELSALCRKDFPSSRIDEAENVMQAIHLMQKENPPYDAVFTDINMPEISGLKLIPMIRNLAHYKNTPVIVVSTLSGKSDVDRAIELGASGYLIRPLQQEDFDVVRVAVLDPLLAKKKKAAPKGADEMVDSLRKMLK